ncbi:bifunctional adenosylcobinamide kinase/adenosylcobinamide-phosphate guanylyltransferase [Nocardioides sp.]|uniref:bifunctional adenosylcobinamide kinase/adenosylcobinamide-phosphate guanylyltransferase n=1 Tax=Nocardioides sp. TaxID=35761 RepID=UPI003D152DF5
MKTLVIGGARSGKSRAAETVLMGHDDVLYVATGYPVADDPEWAARVSRHQADRPASWTTVETIDLVELLVASGGPMLVDCLTLWLTRQLDAVDAWEHGGSVEPATTALVDAVRRTTREVVFVTNEVGQGVVPATVSGRRFRDEMGLLNAAVAAACDDVIWCVAGRTVRL